MMLAKETGMPPEQALDAFYSSRTAQLLADPKSGLQLMSDPYVFEDLMDELNQAASSADTE